MKSSPLGFDPPVPPTLWAGRGGLDEASAAELIWGITSPELFQLFSEYRGWTREQYGRWLTEVLRRLLLP